jgi:hypothetical protein
MGRKMCIQPSLFLLLINNNHIKNSLTNSIAILKIMAKMDSFKQAKNQAAKIFLEVLSSLSPNTTPLNDDKGRVVWSGF